MADVQKTVEIALRVSGVDTKGITSLISSLNKVQASVNTAKSSMESSVKSIENVKKSIEGLGKAADNGGVKLRTFGQKFETVLQFRAISEIIIQTTQAFKAGVTAVVEYDQALKNLQAITGATNFETSLMGLTILDVASKTKFSAKEIADGMVVIGQAGFTATESIQAMQSIADLATGTLSDMATTVDLVTTALRVFNIDASDTEEVVDVFANAVNRSKLTVDKLRIAMNYLGPIARDAGVTFKELSAAMGTLANSGIRASTIGTGLRRVFAELVDPSKKMAKAAREAGITLAELDPQTAGLSSAMQNLNLILNDAQTAFDIFGKRGAAAALALANSGTAYNEMLETVSRSGTAAEQASKQMEGLAVQFKNLKDRLGVLAIAIGNLGFVEAARLIVIASKEIIDVLTILANSTFAKAIVKAALLGAAMFSLYKSILLLAKLGTVITALRSMATGFIAVQAASVGAATGVLGFTAALGPIALIVAGITAAVVFMTTSMKESSEEASQSASLIAAKYTELSKRMKKHRQETIRNVEGSKELAEENKDLRKDLLEVANGFGALSEHAAKAVASINPLTGEIKEGSTAIAEFSEEVDRLNLEKLVEAANSASEALKENTDWWSRTANSAKDALFSISNLLNGEVRSAYVKASEDAHAFAIRVNEGGVEFEEYAEKIREWKEQPGGMVPQQQAIADGFELINEKADLLVETLRRTNKVSLENTVESFRKAATAANVTGDVFDAVILKLTKLKELNKDDTENIIEKWAKDADAAPISKFAEAYIELKGHFQEDERASIAAAEAKKVSLVQDLNNAKAVLKQELSAGSDKVEALKKYNAEVVRLKKEAYETQKILAQSQAAQNIIAIQDAQKKYELAKKDNAAKYDDEDDLTSLKLKYKYEAELFAEFEAKKKQLAQRGSDDYTEDLAEYKKQYKDKELAFTKYIGNIAQLEASRVITEEEANKRRTNSTLDYYAQAVKAAKAYRDEVSETSSEDEFDKRQALVVAAEKKLQTEKTKVIIESAKITEEAEIAQIERSESIRESLYANNVKKRLEATKTLISEIKLEYEKDLLNIAEYYDKRRAAAEEDTRANLELLSSEIESRKKYYDDLIGKSNSLVEQEDLEAKKTIEINELTQDLNTLRQELIQTTNDLTAAEDKATEALQKKVDSILSSIEKERDASLDGSESSTFEEKQQREMEALDKRLSDQYDLLVQSKANEQELKDALAMQDEIRREAEKKREKALFDYRLKLAADFSSNSASALKDLMDSGIVESEKAFRAYQAFAVTEAIINTYKAATGAYASLSNIPYVGPVLGAAAAAAAIASGLAQVAQIKAQRPSYAEGGMIGGSSPHPKADNHSVNVTSGEFVEPVDVVRHYGASFFEGLRKKLIPKSITKGFDNFSLPTNAINRVAFATGGMVSPPTTNKKQGAASSNIVINLNNKGVDLQVESQTSKTIDDKEVIDIVLSYAENNRENFGTNLSNLINR
ncbi:MAG: phage tail tape measure protein [bacterium]|nr:phage tail tape measure protein [bacterium]